jgi:hypothetical protein
MVKAQIIANNPEDSAIRTWGLSVDKIPRGNWRKDESVIQAERNEGDLWEFDFLPADGDHVLYFVVSQPSNMGGGYDGVATFDTAGFNFKGADNDTIMEFPVTVKNGKATRNSPKSQASTQDVPENKAGVNSARLAKLKAFGSKVKGIKDWTRKQQATAAGIVTVIGLGIGFAAWFFGKKKKRF